MKDIKLTIEDIKKIFECFEVEDFTITEDYSFIKYKDETVFAIDYPDHNCNKWVMPLFLTRVVESIKIEAFNRGCFNFPYKIDISDNRIGAYVLDPNYGDTIDFEDFHFTKATIDQAKIKAIKYILDKLK